jgi:hypothetical protein
VRYVHNLRRSFHLRPNLLALLPYFKGRYCARYTLSLKEKLALPL